MTAAMTLPARPRKRPKSFLQKARKFGKLGQRGRGTNIAQDQYDYLVRVMEQWRDGFPSEEERRIFVANVFKQMEGDERNLCGNQLASRVIEMLLPSASSSVMLSFCTALATDLRLVCSDSFASHVLEKLLILACFKSASASSGAAAIKPDPEITDWVKKVCRFLTNNFADFCVDTYASHLLRTCAQCLAGARASESRPSYHQQADKRTEGYANLNQFRYADDSEFVSILELFADRIGSSLDSDLAANELASSVVQIFLQSVAAGGHRKTVKTLLKFLMDKIFTRVDDFMDEPGLVRLLETMVSVGSLYEKLSVKLFDKLFAGRLTVMAVHSGGNFLVQRLIDSLGTGEQLETVWSELSSSLEQILDAGCTGVVLNLVKASVKMERIQAAVLEQLSVSLHCADSLEQLAPLTLRLVNRDRVAAMPSHEFPISLHGSLILQEMLRFNKPIKVVRSILSIEGAELRRILSDPRGSHLADAFMQSKTVGEKSREGLVRRLAGEMTQLACTKHGSRALDALWKHSSLKIKQVIVEELSQQESQLASNQFGKFAIRTCAIAAWLHQRDEWKKIVSQTDKNLELFKDIIGDVSSLKRPAESGGTKVKKDPAAAQQQEMQQQEQLPPLKKIKTEEDIISSTPSKEKKKKKKSYFDDL